jgi:hypothetical protein
MATGTSLVALKQALVTALRARAGLTGVQVLYWPDDFLVGDDHLKNEAIWFGNARWLESEIQVLTAGTKPVDEVYEIDWYVQVLKEDGSTQETADLRAVALLAELQQALAETPQPSTQSFWALIRLGQHFTGQLVPGPNHGSRFEGTVEVRARLAP